MELIGVLSSDYDLGRKQSIEALERLISTRKIVVERTDIVGKALRRLRSGGGDFADRLIERSAAAEVARRRCRSIAAQSRRAA